MFNDLMDKEYDAWRKVCALLETTGAATRADLEAPASRAPETKGEELIRAIVAWGDLKSRLDFANADHGFPARKPGSRAR